jgi:MSHA biogenesis protein MshL
MIASTFSALPAAVRRRILFSAALLPLAGCQSPQLPQGVVQNTIEASVRQAAEPRVRAAAPDAVREALLPPLMIEMPSAQRPVEPRFDLVVNNASAQQVFLALVSGTRYSMLVHPDVKEPISVNMKDVTLIEALEAIREVYGYEYRVQGTRIYIEPVTMQTRIFHVNYLAGRRTGRADVRVSSGSIQASSLPAGGGQPGPVPSPTTVTPGGSSGTQQALESSRVTFSSDNDFWSDMQAAIRTIIGTQGGRSAIVNANSGVVMVHALPKELRAVEQYLKATAGVVERQVMLEAKIIEVTLSDQFASGVNWAAFRSGDNTRFAAGVVNPNTTIGTSGSLSNPNLTFTPRGTLGALGSTLAGVAGGLPGAIFGLAFQTGNFAALLNFLESQGTVHVLSSPRIATLNNQKAVIKVGTDEFFVTNVTTTTTINTGAGGNTISPTITTQPFFSGIALDVTPQISGDDQITLHIHPSVSVVSEKTKIVNLGGAQSVTLPLASSSISESDSIVRVQDGTIAAIGGLMRQQQNNGRSGLPGTTDSAAGILAGTRDQQLTKSELVILLKVTIIRGDSAWQQQAQELNERMLDLRRPMQAAP